MTGISGAGRGLDRARADHAEIVTVKMTTGTSIELMRTRYRAQIFPKHTHEFFTIGLMLRGAGSLWYRGAEHISQRGDIVVIPPGEVHTGALAPGADVLEYVAAHVPADIVAGCANQDAGHDRAPDIEAPVLRDDVVAAQLRRLNGATGSEASDHAAADEALTAALGLLVERHARPRSFGSANGYAGCDRNAEPRVVQLAREVLCDCYGDSAQTSLAALALRTGVSPFHLVRVFTRAVGLSPHQYLVQTRIRRATDLLARGVPCSFVAATTGFADQSHLTRQFKRYLGITPASYQRCLRVG